MIESVIWQCPNCATRHNVRGGEARKCICGTVREASGQVVADRMPAEQRLDVNYDRSSGKVVRWGKAIKRWIKFGRPTRNRRQVRRIWRICRRCPSGMYDRETQTCTVCECRVNLSRRAMLNKLAMGTEECPLGYWRAVVELTPQDQKKGCHGCGKRAKRKRRAAKKR